MKTNPMSGISHALTPRKQAGPPEYTDDRPTQKIKS